MPVVTELNRRAPEGRKENPQIYYRPGRRKREDTLCERGRREV
jgi:hypothetical protein